MKTIYLAGGCFWGCQKFFDQFDGVIKTETGYANGPEGPVTYEEVCRDSGHAETVKIDYDESVISLRELLEAYFSIIDPLSVNRQGHDTGIQYRTGIYYVSEDQLPEIRQVYGAEEQKAGAKLAVEAEPLRNFCSAEEYHQKYLDKHPDGYCHIPAAFFNRKRGVQSGDDTDGGPDSVTIRSERISAEEYIDFLKRTDLGSQYPKERFEQRIAKLVDSVSISLIARNAEHKVVGALFGLTDFSYWLYVTDLGVAREYEGKGIGTRLMKTAHALAGGEKDIAVYLIANENAIPFYEKLGMKKAEDVMQYNHIEWTEFTVE